MKGRGLKAMARLLAVLLALALPAQAEGDALPVEAEAAWEAEEALEDAPEELDGSLALMEPDEGPADGEASQPEAGGAVLPNDAAPGVGYCALAAGAEVWADAALTASIGSFPGGATVYVEAVEADGAALRIRFDTDEARAWADEVPAGYVRPEAAMALDAEALEEALMEDGRSRAAGGALVPRAEYASTAPAKAFRGLDVAERTQAQVQAFVDAHPAYAGQVNLYSVPPKEAPYAVGRLSAVNQQSALNLIGQMRYIAGLDGELALLPEREAAVASAALVLRLNGMLTHYPKRPEALSESRYDDLYSLGYSGAGASNIAKGYKVTGSILAYMADSDAVNAATLGHRRWILNPGMGKTVMGANGSYSAMYVHDQSGAGSQTRVAWPGANTPVQYFSADDPWSLSLGRELDAEKVAVSLVRVADGATWRFSREASDGDFYVENHSYGQKGCVIFRPEGLEGIGAGETFNVSVDDGTGEAPIRYTVRFFRLDLSRANPLDRPDVAAEKTRVGVALSWSAVSRAEGYYVCRRTADTQYGIVADVEGTSWVDASASVEEVYNYQVYAYAGSVTSAQAASVRPTAPEPTGVKLNQTGTVTLYTSQTLRLSAGFTPAWAESALTWKSSKSKYATVDSDGLVKPVKAGTTVISVRTGNGHTASVKVKVVTAPKPTKVKLNRTGTVKLKLGETLQLSAMLSPAKAASKLSWSSSNRKVAKVTSAGLVKPVKAGTATITVKTANGKKARVKVKVVDPSVATGVKLNRTGTVKLKARDTLPLIATVLPTTASSKLTWTSSDRKVVKVSATGVVTGLKAGTATITVKTANGKKARVKVKVGK